MLRDTFSLSSMVCAKVAFDKDHGPCNLPACMFDVASRCSTVPMYRSLVGFGFGYTALVTDRHSMSSGGQSVDSFLVFWILHTFSARLVRMPRVPVCNTVKLVVLLVY